MAEKDFHVSIIGGGIGGLSLAMGLVKAGVPVDVFEAAPAFTEIGAGIGLGHNARSALAKLGFGNVLDGLSTPISSCTWFEFRKGEGDKQELIATRTREPRGATSIHRARLLQVLERKVPNDVCHFGKKFKNLYALSGEEAFQRRVRLEFEDGTTSDTDIVIGCDGIHSKVRGHINERASEALGLKWSGTRAYRGLISTDKFKEIVGAENGTRYAETPQQFLGKGKHLLTFPLGNFEMVNIVAFTTDYSQWPKRPDLPPNEPWVQKSSQMELLEAFAGWGPDTINILKCMGEPSKWALHQVSPSLKSYVRGRVAVMGDAAHGGTPHQGAMAGQAIEDALFLTRLLSHPGVNASNVEEALQAYNVRVARANKVLETSLEAGDVYEFHGPPGSDEVELKKNLESRYDWIWEHDHDAEFNQAEQMLKRKGIA